MNIAALLGTSGILPDQLGKAITAGVNSSEFKQLFQNMVLGQVTPEASAPTLVAAGTTGAPALPQADLLSTLFKLFDKDFGQTPTLDPTGEASDAEQDDTKASLTELLTALQPLVGQSDVTLATGQATFSTQHLVQLTTPQPQQPATNSAAGTTPLPAGANTPTPPIDIAQPQPTRFSNTAPVALGQAVTFAQTDAATPATAPTTPSTSNPNPALSQTTTPPLSAPTTAASTSTPAAPPPAATTALPAAGTPAEGVINAPNTANNTASSATPSAPPATVNDAPARAAATFAQALGDAASATPAAPDGSSQPATPPMAASTGAAAAMPASHIAATGSQPPAFTGALPQNRPEQPPVETTTGPAAQPTEATAGANAVKPAAAPQLPNLPAFEQLTESVKLMVQQGETEVRLQLQPKALGQVHIQLHLTQEGQLTVRMLTETAQAQHLIHEHLPQLKAAMSAQGMQVSQLNVDVGSDSSAFYNQARNSGHNPFAGSQHTPNNRSFANNSNSTSRAAQNQARSGSLNAIDYHA